MSRLRLAVVPFVLLACTSEPPPPEIVETAGACGPVFGAETCTWTSAQGEMLVSAGATVPMSAVMAAPDSMPMAWPPAYQADLAMPAGTLASSGLDHYTFAWEPTGHGPLTYLTPHFDFHFNMIPAAERQAIDCTNRTKPATLPTGYILPDEALPPPVAAMLGVDTLIGVCVPNMGMHAIPESDAAASEPFTAAIIVGYYDGKPIFIEPMITKAKLMERQSFDLVVPEIPGASGPYPRTFRAEYHAENEAYRFTFGDFRAAK